MSDFTLQDAFNYYGSFKLTIPNSGGSVDVGVLRDILEIFREYGTKTTASYKDGATVYKVEKI